MISGKILERDEYNWGFDAQSGEFKDLVKAGIVDPTKVVRTACRTRSVAGLLVTPRRWSRRSRRRRLPHAGWWGMGGMGDMDY